MLRHLLKAHFIHFKKTCFSDKLNGTLQLKKWQCQVMKYECRSIETR